MLRLTLSILLLLPLLPAQSPARIAFVRRDSPGAPNHIHLTTIDSAGRGSTPTRLTNTLETENYPSWSPDGTRLTFQRDLNGSAIYIVNADGSGLRRLSPTPGFDVTPSWSPDGTRLIYTRLLAVPQPDKPPLTELRVINADGTGDQLLLPATTFSVEPRWSPNNQIVFMSLMSGTGLLDIYTINADGSNLRRLTFTGNNGDPVWSPDGTQITFGSDREGNARLNLFIMNADGSAQRPLTAFDPPIEAGDTNWSSDGKKITFQYGLNGAKQSDPNAFAEVWTMNADGTGLTSTGIRCSNDGCAPRWQPTSTPTITRVSNAASGSPAIAPNTWVEIRGTNLAPATRIWRESDFLNGQLPTSLDQVSVTLNGKPAYLYYASPTQLNILTPPDPLPPSVEIQVRNNAATSALFPALAQSISPAFFQFTPSPYAAATHADGSSITINNPARPGEIIIAYATGFGQLTPTITIANLPAQLLFSGPISPGLLQINIAIPTALPPGDHPLTATLGTQSTQPGVLLPVR